MHVSRWMLRGALLIVATVAAVALIAAEYKRVIPYPEGFRTWQHVKSIVIGSESELFPTRGGIHHYYANEQAVIGYRTGKFPNGSVIVDEAVFTKSGEGKAKGILLENERRFLDVMVKDDRLYKQTGGWGFEHFELDTRTGHLSVSDQAECHGCHANAKDRDLVFSAIRP